MQRALKELGSTAAFKRSFSIHSKTYCLDTRAVAGETFSDSLNDLALFRNLRLMCDIVHFKDIRYQALARADLVNVQVDRLADRRQHARQHVFSWNYYQRRFNSSV